MYIQPELRLIKRLCSAKYYAGVSRPYGLIIKRQFSHGSVRRVDLVLIDA